MSEAYLEEKNIHGRYVHQLPPGVISPELRPVVEELGLEENCRQLAHEGYTIVEDVAPPAFIARLREKILEITPEKAFEFGAEGATTDSRIEVMLLEKDPIFAEACLNPKMMAMAEFSVGRGFLAYLLNCTIRGKGCKGLYPHSDNTFEPLPFSQHNMMLSACWALDEFTKEGGATLVIPGSHSLRRYPSDREVDEARGAIAAECPAGSAVLWDGRIWHGNYPRTIEGERVIFDAVYSRLMVRPQEDYSPHADELIAKHGPRMAQLIGRNDGLYKRGDYSKAVEQLMNVRR
jgi:hypothetical protein